MKTIKLMSMFGLIAIVGWSCSNLTAPINSEADIIGIITEINSNSEQLEILVEEDPAVYGPDKENGKKILLTISAETEIYKRSDIKSSKKIKSEDLKIGLKVKAWASQWVLLSYPAQAGALKIIIIGN